MEATGQLGRLTRHFTAYRDAGHALTYFSGLPNDPDWVAEMVRPTSAPATRNGTRRALLRPLREPRAWRRCDVLRATSLAGAISCLTARVALGVPFVVSLGAKYEEIARLHGRPAWKWNALRRFAVRLAAAVIVPNPVHARETQARFPRARIVHVPNWVDTQMFRPGPRPGGRPTVLYVGRLVVEKNLKRLASVCREHGWRLICVGEGPGRDDLTALGAECPGAVPWEDLPAWHAKAHVFCLPSFTEGHPKALLEAMASGLPCAVSTGVTGFQTATLATFPPASSDAMGEAIHAMMTGDSWVRPRVREYALAYDIARVLPQEIRVVEEAAR